MFRIFITTFVFSVVSLGCSWEQLLSGAEIVVYGSGRDILSSSSLSFPPQQSLVLQLTDDEGRVIAQNEWNQAAPEYRLKAGNLVIGRLYRAMALLKDTEHHHSPNRVTHMDFKEFLATETPLTLNLRMGQTFAKIELATETLYNLIDFESQQLDYTGITVDPTNTTLYVYIYKDYHPNMESFEYSINALPFIRTTDFSSTLDLPLKVGRNFLIIRYRQESDNRFVTYRFLIDR